jgi:hypothetical protein
MTRDVTLRSYMTLRSYTLRSYAQGDFVGRSPHTQRNGQQIVFACHRRHYCVEFSVWYKSCACFRSHCL